MSGGENIRVICRVRPPNGREVSQNVKPAVQVLNTNSLSIENKQYSFDAVLSPTTTQEQAYTVIAKPIVDCVLNGYNGTIFAYGQTASGKTYTMEGHPVDPQLKGVVPRVVEDIFNKIAEMSDNLQFLIKVSYLEVYMEKIMDLLDPTKENLAIGETKARVPYVKGATERYVASPEEVLECLDDGRRQRKVAETKMNDRSSRSHSVFILSIISEDRVTFTKRVGQVYLVDLAGSEKISKTKATGQTLDEGKMINLSLSTLGKVINALVEKQSHIPYRDSKLTRILQNSLGGNSKTTLVICISPAEYNKEESKSTLYFGLRAKTIKNKVSVNVELTAEEWKARHDAMVDKYNKLRQAYEQLLAETKRWRAGEKVPIAERFDDTKVVLDTNVEMGPVSSTLNPPLSPVKNVRDASNQDLYRLIDSKDEEISKLSQQISKNKPLVEKIQADLEKAIKEKEKANEENVNLHKSVITARTELREVLYTLEELATSYESNIQEMQKKQEAIEQLQDMANKWRDSMNVRETLVKTHREQLHKEHELWTRMLSEMLQEVLAIGDALNCKLPKPPQGREINLESEMATLRYYMNQVKNDAINGKRLPVKKSTTNETANMVRNEARQSLKNVEEEISREMQRLAETRKIFLQQLQLRTGSVNSSVAPALLQELKTYQADGNQNQLQQKEAIAIMQATIENLEKCYNDAIKEVTQLKVEKTTFEKRLNTSREKVKSLETELQNARYSALTERKRYQAETMKIKELLKNKALRSQWSDHVAKPVFSGRSTNKGSDESIRK